MNTIDEALDYLYSFINYETDSSFAYGAVHYNVDRTVKLLNMLNNPEKESKIIHVAGTKGKGSLCHILSALLRVQGITVGMFTSPHIMRVNERISKNGIEIEDNELIDLLNKFPSLIDTFPPDNLPTTFEILTALAMYFFSIKGVEYTILETGMGGRFDSTNFSDPLISIITSISYDHMDKLGERIEEIASEKAGIMKQNRPVVVGYQKYEVFEIFREKASRLNSQYYRTEDICSYHIEKLTPAGSEFSALIDGVRFEKLFLSMSGKHQVENAVSALLALKVLDLLPDEHGVREALKGIAIPVRLELIVNSRRFLLDSAHNEDSARTVCETVKSVYSARRIIVVVGIVKGKDIQGILENVSKIADTLIITEPITHKELNTDLVYNKALELFPAAILIENIYEAIDYAVKITDKADLIFITGSFYITSPARCYLAKIR
jgi:dihydrofolate synthase/folylpolyglutamate synthase